MRVRTRFVLLVLLALAAPAAAQHGHGSPPPTRTAPREASQFDFLVGQWEIVAQPRVEGLAARIHGSPKFPGTWKAWRALDGWGIEDELRLTDESGNPRAFTHCVRMYDPTARQWKLSLVDVYRSTVFSATGEWRDDTMHVSSQGTDADGRAYKTRTRFHDISANGFRLQQDRSYDDGHTWIEEFLRIEAKRVSASAPR